MKEAAGLNIGSPIGSSLPPPPPFPHSPLSSLLTPAINQSLTNQSVTSYNVPGTVQYIVQTQRKWEGGGIKLLLLYKALAKDTYC